jgi:HAD superfamily hydrolase (TIGR01549 family)
MARNAVLPATDEMKMSAVIFDVDGTLVDSNVQHAKAWQSAFAAHNKNIPLHAIHEQIGKGADQLLPAFLSAGELQTIGQAVNDLRALTFRRDYLPGVRAFPGVRRLFERLKADQLCIALATSSPKDELQHSLEVLDVSDLVDFVTSADRVQHSKPQPDVFRQACDGLKGVPQAECVVVGDSPYDAIAARRAGMNPIGVLSGGFSGSVLREAGATAVYASLLALVEAYPQWLEGATGDAAA